MGKMRKIGESSDANERRDKNGQTEGREVPQINKIIGKFTEKQPWKIMYMNAERLVTKNSKKKVEYLTEYVEENKVLIMNLTETWLKQYKKI